MPVKIDDKIDLEKIRVGLKWLDRKNILVGVSDKNNPNIEVIASANEFGAQIKSLKARQYLAMIAAKAGVTYTGIGKGYIQIPERSFLRSTFNDPEVGNVVRETMSFYLQMFLRGKNTAEEVLTRAGNILKQRVQSRIASNLKPKNSITTETIKGHGETLLGKDKGSQAGSLISSIDYEIVD